LSVFNRDTFFESWASFVVSFPGGDANNELPDLDDSVPFFLGDLRILTSFVKN